MNAGPRVTVIAAAVGAVVVFAGSLAAASVRPRQAHDPACSKLSSRGAVAASPLGPRMKHPLGEDPTSIDWGVQLICRPLAGHDRMDMVAEFECCTVHSATPLAILRPDAGAAYGWRLSYSSVNPILYGLRVRGKALIERRPVWKRNDVLCCPTGVTQYWSVGWDGYGWDVHRVPPAAY
jgi:hypothetical protein